MASSGRSATRRRTPLGPTKSGRSPRRTPSTCSRCCPTHTEGSTKPGLDRSKTGPLRTSESGAGRRAIGALPVLSAGRGPVSHPGPRTVFAPAPMGLRGLRTRDLLGRQVDCGLAGTLAGFAWHPCACPRLPHVAPRGKRGCLRPLARQVRIEGLLAETRRQSSDPHGLRAAGPGDETKHGPLDRFLTAHDERGLDAYFSFTRWLAPAPVELPAPQRGVGLGAWARRDRFDGSAKTAVSKIMGRLRSGVDHPGPLPAHVRRRPYEGGRAPRAVRPPAARSPLRTGGFSCRTPTGPRGTT